MGIFAPPPGYARATQGITVFLPFFGGLVTGEEAGKIKVTDSGDCVNVEVETGIVKPARGYRNLVKPVTNQTTMKGAWWCQTYVSSVLFEAFVTFDKVAGTVKPYELAHDSSTDDWARTVVTAPGGTALSLQDAYWRSVCFADLAYFFQKDDTHHLYKYTLGDYDSFVPVEPPAKPTTAPNVDYFLNSAGGNSYTKYMGPQASYAASDVTLDGVVFQTATLVGQSIGGTIKATGRGTIRGNLKHSAASVDLSNCDVFECTVTVGDAGACTVDLENIVPTLHGGVTDQDLVVSIVSRKFDSAQRLQSVRLYIKFGGKTRSSWTASTYVTFAMDVTAHASDTTISVSPLTAGGIANWGDQTSSQWRALFTRTESTTTLESGPSLARNFDPVSLFGQLLDGNPEFPMGTIPVVTMTAASDSDTLNLYAAHRTPDGQTPWRLIVSQSDATLTYTWIVTPDYFETKTEYAPSDFDPAHLVGAFQMGQFLVWLREGGLDNVRLSRYRTPAAQAGTEDAFRTDLGQDDAARGVNYTLTNKRLDQPVGGVAIGRDAVVLSQNGAYLIRQLGLYPKDTLPPVPIADALGCFGPSAFCEWHDKSGNPIVVYVAAGGGSVWAIRVPAGIDPGQPVSQAAYEFAPELRDGLLEFLFGNSVNKDSEALCVFVDPRDDSLHLRYSAQEIVLSRPSLIDGKRKWTPRKYDTAQWGDQWQKVVCFKSSGVDFGIFGFRLNGAVDEFVQTSLKSPGSTSRVMQDVDAAGKTPASLSATVATFSAAPGWASGTPVKVTTTGNGLTAGTQYYFGRVTYLTGSFYLTQANAQGAGATGRVTLTSTGAWAAGAVLPNGPMDGNDYTNVGCHWETKRFFGPRRRADQVMVERVDTTDATTLNAYADRDDSSAKSMSDGDRFVKFGPQVSGDSTRYRVTLGVRHSGVRSLRISEEPIGQRRQR